MLKSSIHLGTIAGIRIGFHYSWLIIFLLLTMSLHGYFMQVHTGWTGGASLVAALLTSLFFFASIVLHELGHSFVAIARGVPVRAITLFIFGGMAQTEKEPESAASEFWIAIAGPAVSFALAGFFFLVYRLFEAADSIIAVASGWLASINFVLAVFNLLPGFPLDGGRVFRALVWHLSGDPGKGMRWAVGGGRAVAYGLVALGLLVMLRTGQILNGVWFMAIGLFLLSAAEASGRAYATTRALSGIRVRDVMRTDVPVAAASLSITRWLEDHVLTSGERAFLITDGTGPRGLVTMSDCRKLPRDRWDATVLSEVATPMERLHTASPDTDINDVLQLMASHSLNQVPVLDNEVVIGWVDRDRLLKIIRLRAESTG